MADLTKTFLAQRFKRESPIPQEKQKRRKTKTICGEAAGGAVASAVTKKTGEPRLLPGRLW
jgi:hypothetical protein